MDYLETKPANLSLIKGDRILALFQTPQSLENALTALMLKGYSRADIVVKIQEENADKNYLMDEPVEEETDAVTLQKAIGGIKYGALLGSLLFGVAIAYLILFQAQILQAGPLATSLFGLAVGAVLGGTLGFIIGPQLPYSQVNNHEMKPSKKKMLLSFQPRSLRDAHFFKSLNWPMYTLA